VSKRRDEVYCPGPVEGLARPGGFSLYMMSYGIATNRRHEDAEDNKETVTKLKGRFPTVRKTQLFTRGTSRSSGMGVIGPENWIEASSSGEEKGHFIV